MKYFSLILAFLLFVGNQKSFASMSEIDTSEYITDEQLRSSALAKDYDDEFVRYIDQYKDKLEILKAFKKYICKEINVEQNRALVIFQKNLSEDELFHECGSGGAYFGYRMYAFY